MHGNRERLFHKLYTKASKSKAWSAVFHFYCLYVMGFEFEARTKVGDNLSIVHGARGSVINPGVVIGDNCIIRNNTIIGNKGIEGGEPIIGNNVNIGANSCIIGPIKIGNNVVIGAGSVVVKDVPSNVIVAGNPAKIIRHIDRGADDI